jgi:acyl-CoA synthetase (NDP forming)
LFACSRRSIAIIGASPHERSAGRAVLRKVIAGGFTGTPSRQP